jgi:hypothetical protein
MQVRWNQCYTMRGQRPNVVIEEDSSMIEMVDDRNGPVAASDEPC